MKGKFLIHKPEDIRTDTCMYMYVHNMYSHTPHGKYFSLVFIEVENKNHTLTKPSKITYVLNVVVYTSTALRI